MTTGRALESQPPSLVGQVLGALFLCRKFLLEIQQAPVFVRIWHDELHLALKNSKLGANWIGINYKTKVNHSHTKVGIAKDSFNARKKSYLRDFDNEVEFIPVAIIPERNLEQIEKIILEKIKKRYSKVGYATEWFDTDNRDKILQLISQTLTENNIK